MAALAPSCFSQASETHSPQILLTSQRLRRLKRDRERQTMRWVDFETRVKTVPDSTERGFELALYYAITNDEPRGREAVLWAKDHPCEERQVALVLDWAGNLMTDGDRQLLSRTSCPQKDSNGPRAWRDRLFRKIATDQDVSQLVADSRSAVPSWVNPETLSKPADFYAVCEFLGVMKSSERVDLREGSHDLFTELPQEFLLRLRPQQQEHPDWMTHSAALALVDLDPNLEGSQYLQGWALQDNQVVREGPGVAYEMLWADPYLPGVSYQNMDPWLYRAGRGLLARTDWNLDSCWVDISAASVEQENCPARWQDKDAWFGRLHLVPMTASCVNLPMRKSNTALILWKLRPRQALTYESGEKTPAPSEADELGLWHVPTNAEGKVCTKHEGSTRPSRQ